MTAMDIKDKRKSYSDLEAIVVPSSSSAGPEAPQLPAGRKSYWNEKIVAASTDPEPVPSNYGDKKVPIEGSSPIDTLPPPPPAYYLVDSRGQTQALYTAPTNNSNGSSDAESIVNVKAPAGYDAATPPAPGGWWKSMGQGRRILGMRKNVFLAVCAGLCVLILGLLLTILLVTRTISFGKGGGGGGGSKNNDIKAPPFSALELLNKKDQGGALLAATSLAAMNWTDLRSGVVYTGVFYQSSRATGMSLMASIKNEATSDWTTLNMSASASANSGGAVLDVLPGTPIAAANNNGLWNVIYLSSSFALQELYATDPMDAKGWSKGEMAARLGNPTAAPGSGLGAMWQSCSACDNALFVMWQDGASGDIVYANETNLTWNEAVTISSSGAPGSSVAVSAFTDVSNIPKTGADKNAVRFYYENGDELYEMMKGPLGGGQLTLGNYANAVAKDLSLSPSPALASMTYGAATTGWTNNLLAYIDPWKGGVTSANWQGVEWKITVPTLRDSPDGVVDAGFSSVALTQSMRVYLMCPAMGEIHEFTFNATDPTEWTWQETIAV